MYINSFNAPKQPHKVGNYYYFHFLVRTLRHGEVKHAAQGHVAAAQGHVAACRQH